jgi:hypothetical protein
LAGFELLRALLLVLTAHENCLLWRRFCRIDFVFPKKSTDLISVAVGFGWLQQLRARCLIRVFPGQRGDRVLLEGTVGYSGEWGFQATIGWFRQSSNHPTNPPGVGQSIQAFQPLFFSAERVALAAAAAAGPMTMTGRQDTRLFMD